uniref:CAAX prenyl protease 2/Lysostaphin resistance protein A-like domain-containing protein n=1 Tax=Noccaea caerulescens TaxID=107243 RepID=A0A1J3EUF6_NOCCA
MILSRWVSFTPVARSSSESDELFRRHSEFRGLSSTCRLRSGPCCLKSKSSQDEELESVAGLSILGSEIPWEEKKTWSTMAFYMFCLHIPLSFGGLSMVSGILHQRHLEPQTQVLSLVLVQMVELSGTVFLLRNTAKPQCKSINFLKGNDDNNNNTNNDSNEGRYWVVGSALGLACIVGFVFLTSLVADQLFGSKAVHNSELEKIMASGEVSRSGCFALYCLVAPILEEIVYRRFLLSSLASRMEWKKALVISSGVFAASHMSGEDLVQLFGIGCVLGACYSWSGNLASSVLVHSLYNALTLLLADSV